MMENNIQNAQPVQPVIYYEIRIKSHIDCDWSDWFENLKVTQEEGGITLLSGPITDQAALYGLLKRINSLGMQLISFTQVKRTHQEELSKGGTKNDYRTKDLS